MSAAPKPPPRAAQIIAQQTAAAIRVGAPFDRGTK